MIYLGKIVVREVLWFMKNKLVWKVIVVLCLSPIILNLLCGIYWAIFGTEPLFCMGECDIIYGFEAFKNSLYTLFLLLVYFWYVSLLLFLLLIISIINLVKK